MPRQVVFSRRARRWIEAETEYLSARSLAAAERFLARLEEAERLLSEYPHAGRRHQVPGIRQFVIAPYVLRYREVGPDLEIIDIRHHRQQEHPLSVKPE